MLTLNTIVGSLRRLQEGGIKRGRRHLPLGENSSGQVVVALAGNPNVGKSTLFNRLTGLRQHTGNWPGKTITRAEGGFWFGGKSFRIVDLPGTYSLLTISPDEEVARDFLLFERPDVTVVVMDATALERNLNLTLQILQITDSVVVCVNLLDEARAHGVEVDLRKLESELGVRVVGCSAKSGEGILELLDAILEVADIGRASIEGLKIPRPEFPARFEGLVSRIFGRLHEIFPSIRGGWWVALRLLCGDNALRQAFLSCHVDKLVKLNGGIRVLQENEDVSILKARCAALLSEVEEIRWELPLAFEDRIAESFYGLASKISSRCVRRGTETSRLRWQRRADFFATHPIFGFPIMLGLFALVLWVTIVGSNYPSSFLAWLLVEEGHSLLRKLVGGVGFPGWVVGVFVDGVYLTTAWVVSVMLPPMAIFFPLFTILEDLGYLPRVAFNLDRLFQAVGSHGKQSLTMCMGLGCNAAGVVSCRIIDSPRERLIAILTNNFSLCNGRWPTQILIATIFLGSLVPPFLAGVVATGAVFGVAVLGFVLALLSSFLLSRTFLRGISSTFSLELPPYRPPNVLRTLYTSLIDRTIFVLWRAVVFAAPAGAVIWLIANIGVGGKSLAEVICGFLSPLGNFMGLNGTVLLAYLIGIPANEIVLPAILMLTVLVEGIGGVGAGAGVLFEADDPIVYKILTNAGWTSLTAVCLMLFSLCHNPCSTTLFTIYKETGSWRWTLLAAMLPLIFGFVLCSFVALIGRTFFGF